MSEIVIRFKETPHSISAPEAENRSNELKTIRLQPNEGIDLRVTIMSWPGAACGWWTCRWT